MSAEGEGRGSFENESSRAKGAKAAERGGWRERGKVVRKTETWSSCVTSVGARRDIPVSSDLCARHHGGGERRRWQAMEQAIYEKEAKNEDEVNDIHGGYRILPARSHLRLPCLLLSLLRPPSPLPYSFSSRSLSRSIQYVSFSEAPPRFFRSSRANNVYVCIYYP